MQRKHTWSRRDVTRRLGLLAGTTLLPGGIARAALATPRQVEGPFYPVAEQETDTDMTRLEGHDEPADGEIILVRGRVTDIEGAPVPDVVVDVWQANHHGRYRHPGDPNTAPLDPNFQGWAIMQTSTEGSYGFKTIKPAPYPLSMLGNEGQRCRHIHFKVGRPGEKALVTQMYFEGDPLIEQDAEIAKVPRELWPMLIAKPSTDNASGLPLYTFDIRLDSLRPGMSTALLRPQARSAPAEPSGRG